MKEIKVYDDFLSYQDHENISKIMLSNNFPWYMSVILDEADQNLNIDSLDNLEFTHNFFDVNLNISSYIKILNPIFNKIEIKSLVRIRAALIPRRDRIEANAFHTDFNDYNCKTAIYYLNTNNGYTQFENGQRVDSIANRFIEFNSNTLHTGSLTTDSKYRALINFNYF